MGKQLNREHAIVLVLAILEDGPRHGYSIAREVERRSGERVRFNDGNLYPVLHALEEEGCITSEWKDVGRDRPKRIYTITEKGLVEFARHVAAWHDFTSAINDVLTDGSPFILTPIEEGYERG